MHQMSSYFNRTGKQFKKHFFEGISDARKAHHDQFNYRLAGEGLTAEYLCASDQTKQVLTKWLKYDGVETSPARVRCMLRILRDTWTAFMKDPELHVQNLTAVNVFLLTVSFIVIVIDRVQ